MGQSSTYHTLFQNSSLGGKDKLAAAAPTKANNISAVLRTPTPASAVAFATTSSSMAQYLENNL